MLKSARASLACLAAAVAISMPASAQTIEGAKQAQVGGQTVLKVENYIVPKNKMGQPDLTGLWTNATLTTLERPTPYGDRLVMTPEEVAKIEGVEAADVAEGQKPTNPTFKVTDLPVNCGRGFSGVNCGYNGFWVDPGKHVMNVNGEFRTSFLVEPKNGRLPGLTPEATAARNAVRASSALPRGPGFARGDNPESMSLAERCLKDFGSSSGPPMMPLLYNNTYQLVQTPNDVMILTEMVHDARIVHLTHDRTRPAAIKQWMGDAIGWYEGDALVVETTNFRPGQTFRGAPETVKLIEKFRRVNDQQMLYSFEINDPRVFTAPIKAEITMTATPGPLYEYACHEGNYALGHMLAGQRRADEVAAAKAAAAKSPAKPATTRGGQ